MRMFRLFCGFLFLTACNVMPESDADLNATKPASDETSVQFSISDLSSEDAQQLDPSSKILVEYTDAAGEASQETLSLSANGAKLESEALALEPGDYTLTQFLVVKNNEIFFATPQNTSDLSEMVGKENSLPISFKVTAGQKTILNPMVLDTGSKGDGEDFLLHGARGHGFPWKSIRMAQVIALAPDAGAPAPTSATLNIKDGPRSRVYRLKPRVNRICILSNAEQFVLTVTKPGYATIDQTLSREQLIQSGKPNNEIKFALTPVQVPSLKGRVIDAAHGKAVSGVSVQLMANNAEVALVKTAVDGSYNFGTVPVGQYTVVISKAGYISYGQPLNLADFKHAFLRLPISKILPNNKFRMVLTWEDKRSDFDAFLRTVNASTNTQIDLIGWNDLSFKNAIAQAHFTGDDCFGQGFESMSLNVDQAGKYKFSYFVRRYINKHNDTATFPTAGVTVRVFRGDSIVGLFDPNMLDPNPALKQWNVFDIAPDLSVIPVNMLQ